MALTFSYIGWGGGGGGFATPCSFAGTTEIAHAEPPTILEIPGVCIPEMTSDQIGCVAANT